MLNLTEIFDRIGKELEIELEKLEIGYFTRTKVLAAFHKVTNEEITKYYLKEHPKKK
jgi:hypothetical protein